MKKGLALLLALLMVLSSMLVFSNAENAENTEEIIVETDAPFVLPFFEDGTTGKKAKRKIRNTSLVLPGIIRKIAELKAADEAAVESAVFRNTAEIFGLGSRIKRTGR